MNKKIIAGLMLAFMVTGPAAVALWVVSDTALVGEMNTGDRKYLRLTDCYLIGGSVYTSSKSTGRSAFLMMREDPVAILLVKQKDGSFIVHFGESDRYYLRLIPEITLKEAEDQIKSNRPDARLVLLISGI